MQEPKEKHPVDDAYAVSVIRTAKILNFRASDVKIRKMINMKYLMTLTKIDFEFIDIILFSFIELFYQCRWLHH